MKALLALIFVAFAIGSTSAEYHAANMTLMSGQVVALDELYRAANWSCCVPRSVLGDATPVVRIDESQGQYYVTADPECKSAITSDAYPSTYQAIWMCGNCTGADCVPADGGLFLALRGDWCVDSNNTQDALVLCSTAAPLCDAGYSGKCIELADDAKQPLALSPSMTLQSGMVVDFSQLQESYQGQCCLPRSVINDASAVMRMDNSGGAFFVANDPACASPIPSSMYPASFEYVSICSAVATTTNTSTTSNTDAAGDDLGVSADDLAATPVSTSVVVDGGVVLVPAGSVGTVVQCNPYASACWGAAPICSFANVCIGINTYDYTWEDSYWDDSYPWGYYRPAWYRPLAPIYRPAWWQPPFLQQLGGHRPWWNPRPHGWAGGHIPGGWRPGHRPGNWAAKSSWAPPSGWKPDGAHQHLSPVWQPGLRNPGAPAPNPGAVTGSQTGPGVVLPSSPHTTGSSFFSPGRGGATPDGTSSPRAGGSWWQGGGPSRSSGTPGMRGPGSITHGQQPGLGGSTGPRGGPAVPSNPLTPGSTVPGRGIGPAPSTPAGRPSWQITPPRGTTYNPVRGGTPGRSFTPAPAATTPGGFSTPGRVTSPGRTFNPPSAPNIPTRAPTWPTFAPAPTSYRPSSSLFGSAYSAPRWGSSYTTPSYTPRYTPSYSSPRSYSTPRSWGGGSGYSSRSWGGGGGYSSRSFGGGGRSYGGGGRSFGGGGRRGL